MSTAKQTPSVLGALQAYTAELARIPGGEAAKAQSLKAWTWKPGMAPAVMPTVVKALELLVQNASGDREGPSGE